MDEVGEDHYIPIYKNKILRASNRILKRWQISDLEREINAKMSSLRTDVLMVYKGSALRADYIKQIKKQGILTVNIFPDLSPHSHGKSLRDAMGEYDLVISTKPFHPAGWKSIYGYNNKCVLVPHGYDPAVHFWSSPPTDQEYDVVLATSWRPEYHDLMLAFAALTIKAGLSVGVAGPGWQERKSEFPTDWVLAGPLHGRAYGDWVRRGRVVIAPVHTQVVIDGQRQPGDEDTTRTYELAAAFCFFLHRRTPYAQTVYDEETEVPMWDGPEELVQKVLYYLTKEDERRVMSVAAHARAVPNYSIPARAEQVLEHVRAELISREARRS